MSVISLASTAAIIIGLCGSIPQILTMLRARSSAGQSATGWIMGVSVNVLMGYVNLAGYHATILAVGNVVSMTLCLTAFAVVLRFRDSGAPTADELEELAAVRAVRAGGDQTIVEIVGIEDLPTGEFQLIRAELSAVEERRRQRRNHLGETAASGQPDGRDDRGGDKDGNAATGLLVAADPVAA
jgi:hypothetical protein